MSERTVLASFFTHEEASEAAKQIRELGADTAQVDERHKYAPGVPIRRTFLVSGKISSLASVTLHETPSSDGSRVMLAADPAASGMAGDPEDNAGRNYLLTVICDDEKVEETVRIILDNNGYT